LTLNFDYWNKIQVKITSINQTATVPLILISSLFIVLGANVSFVYLNDIWWRAIVLVLLLQMIVRPIAVGLSTIGSNLNWREKLMFSWIAPRGIVAAAVAALFSIKVMHNLGEVKEGELIVLIVFMIILGTVIIQSLTAPMLSKILKTSAPEPRGFLIIGANIVARTIATALKKNDINYILTDDDWSNIHSSRLQGLNCYYGSAVAEHADWHLNLVGIGRILGCSYNPQINVLAAVKYNREFQGRASVFLLPHRPYKANTKLTYLTEKYSRRLFRKDLSYYSLCAIIEQGGKIKTTNLTMEFNWEQFITLNPEAIVLFFITNRGLIRVVSPDSEIKPQPAWKVVFFMPNMPLKDNAIQKSVENIGRSRYFQNQYLLLMLKVFDSILIGADKC